MTCINVKATSTNNVNYLLQKLPIIWGPYHATSCHLLLVTSGMDTHMHIARCTETKAILRNQVHVGYIQVASGTWFKNNSSYLVFLVLQSCQYQPIPIRYNLKSSNA